MKSPQSTLKINKIYFYSKHHPYSTNRDLQKIVDGSVDDGEGGGDAAVDDDADPQHVDDLAVRGLGPDHLVVEVPGDHRGGGQHRGVRGAHHGSRHLHVDSYGGDNF